MPHRHSNSSSSAASEHGHAHRLLARRVASVVVALSIIGPFSTDAYLSSLPDIAAEFGVSGYYLQQTLSVYMIAFAAMTLVYGPLSDTFGRRAVVLGAMVAYVASSIGCALAANAHALLVLRVAQGLSASGGLVVGRALIRDSFSGAAAQRVMSRVMLMFGLAPAIAPVIGGWLHDVFGWRSVFWFLALLGVAVWVWAALFLPETLRPGDRRPGHPRLVAAVYRRALGRGRFMALVAAMALNFGGYFLYVAGSPTILYQYLGYGAQDFWRFFVPMVAGLMTGAYISGRMAGRYTHEQAVVAGFGIMLAAALTNFAINLSLAPSGVTVITPVAVYACGAALAMPNLSLLALDLFPQNRGLASALQSFAQMALGGLVAGLLVPVLAGHVAWFAAGMLIISMTGLMCWWWCRSLS